MEPDLLTPREAAKLLRVSELTMADWLRAGIIPGVKLGTGPKARWRIRRAEIDESIHAPRPRVTAAEMEEIATAISQALAEAGVFDRKESLKLMIQGIEHPTEIWWKYLAAGIRALLQKQPNTRNKKEVKTE